MGKIYVTYFGLKGFSILINDNFYSVVQVGLSIRLYIKTGPYSSSTASLLNW